MRLRHIGSFVLAGMFVLFAFSTLAVAQPASEALLLACGSSATATPAALVAPIRRAGAIVVDSTWRPLEPFGPGVQVSRSTLFDYNSGLSKLASRPFPDVECREAPIATQIARLISAGDPRVICSDGKAAGALSGGNLGRARTCYADAVNSAGPNVPVERAKAWANAVLLVTSNTIVGAGARGIGNVRAQLESCAGGGVMRNSSGAAFFGGRVKCANPAWRQTVTDYFLAGFYNGFGGNILLNLGCDYLLDRANSASTSEWRFAASKALVANSSCASLVPAAGGGSDELEEAAARPLAIDLFNSSQSTKALLGAAADADSTHRQRLAAALAVGFRWELAATLGDSGNVELGSLNLIAFGFDNFNNELANATLAPIARVYLQEFSGNPEEVRLTVGSAPTQFSYTSHAEGDSRVQ